MQKLLGFLGASLIGSVGWWIGARVGVMTGFSLSMIGTGVGLYAGRRIADHLS